MAEGRCQEGLDVNATEAGWQEGGKRTWTADMKQAKLVAKRF